MTQPSLAVAYYFVSGSDTWCSKCGAPATVMIRSQMFARDDYFCQHCTAHHMRGNADALDPLEPDECECPAERWSI